MEWEHLRKSRTGGEKTAMKFDLDLQNNLANLCKARFPYIYMPTWEEQRAVDFILSVVWNEQFILHPREAYVWTQTNGFVNLATGKTVSNTKAPLQALEFVEVYDKDAVFIMKDMHVYFGIQGRSVSYDLIRKMRDIIPIFHDTETRKNIIFVSPRLVLPDDMEKEISVFDFPLPSVTEIMELLDELIVENELDAGCLPYEDREKLAKSALGLTLQEAENAFARAIVSNRGLDSSAIQIIFDEKNQVIKKNGILEFIKSNYTIHDIGGLESLKAWLLKRNNSWLDSARRYNIPAPKGVLITGVPGCGKSLTAKAMSAIWNLPLLKLDVGKIFSGIVGSSEENMRRAIATAEAVAPSILWIDEIEKGISVTDPSLDSGIASRVLGTFLTWMQEKTAPVFVIATANNINALPTELLRKGRFDEIFFVDLPTAAERRKIFEVHLRKKVVNSEVGRDIIVNHALLEELANLTEGFVGAEIEQVVIAALYEAFFNQRNLTVADLKVAIKGTVPLAITQREQIQALREWANVRAVSATLQEDLTTYKVEILGIGNIGTQHGDRMFDFS